MIDTVIEKVAENSPEDTQKALVLLQSLKEEIRSRVHGSCHDLKACSPQLLLHTITRIAYDLLDSKFPKPTRWRMYGLFAGAIATNFGINAAVQHYAHPLLATAMSVVLTMVAVLTVDNLGASTLELPFSKARLTSYQSAADRSVVARRGVEQQRAERVFLITQQLLTNVEEEGRATHRDGVVQTLLGLLSCKPYDGELPALFMKRSALHFGKTLSYLVDTYPDLDFSEDVFADWAQIGFSMWFLDDKNLDTFRKRVMQLVTERFKPEALPGTRLRHRIESALFEWTAMVSERLGTRQSQTEPPSRTEAVP